MPFRIRASLAVLAAALVLAPAMHDVAAQQSGTAWAEVGRILRTPEVATGGYHRYNFPRRDVTLRMGDVTVSPMLALGGWAGFSGEPNDATLMGDLVVTQGELKAALAEFARQEFAVTSIHNHLSGERPTITYIHFHGAGDATALATRLDRVVSVTSAPRPVTATSPAAVTIDTALVFRTMGSAGRAAGNVAQLAFMLVRGPVAMHGKTLVPALAYGSPVSIQMVDGTRAVATGDLAVREAKVEPVVRAFAAHGIVATAVHSHLVGEEPRIYYIHFWGDAPLATLLAGLKAAVDAGREDAPETR